jgi:phosphoribosylanthranilate isomerase
MVEASGADAIGLNFSAASPRFVQVEQAAAIRRALGSAIEVVGVFVNASLSELLEVRSSVGLDTLQLHGHEEPALLAELIQRGASAYKALRIATSEDVEVAQSYEGQRILVDAKAPGMMGGSGRLFDWSLVAGLNQERKMILAGGLIPSNVSEAIAQVHPFGVDTASGVESAPGVKSADLVRLFVERAQRKS